jgi:hypothetical protein
MTGSALKISSKSTGQNVTLRGSKFERLYLLAR